MAKWFKPVPFPLWYKKLSISFRTFFKQQLYVDVIFHCADNEEIGGHQFMLCHASPFFHDLLHRRFCFFNEDNIVHVSLPDFSKDIIFDFLEALYLGAVPTDFVTYKEIESLSQMLDLFNEGKRQDLANISDMQNFEDDEEELEEIENESHEGEIKTEPPVHYVKSSIQSTGVFVIDESGQLQLHQPNETEQIDVELRGVTSQENIDVVKSFQQERCQICNESGIEHRILIHSEEDKRRLGIPIVPSNDDLRFLYRCCIHGCPFQTIRYLKSAAAFHVHMQKHETVILFPSYVDFYLN